MTSENESKFNLVCQVPSEHLEQAKKLAAALGPAIDPATQAFDLEKARAIVRGLPFGQVSKLHQHQFNPQGTAKLSEVLSQVKAFVGEALDIKIEDKDFWSMVDTAIAQVFVNLKAQEGKPWLSYHGTSDANTRYSYNLVLALLSKETGAVMLALPVTFDVTAGLKKDDLLRLTANDTAKHQVSLKALTVLQMISPKVA